MCLRPILYISNIKLQGINISRTWTIVQKRPDLDNIGVIMGIIEDDESISDIYRIPKAVNQKVAILYSRGTDFD